MAKAPEALPLGATHATLRDQVTDELRRMIVDGTYQPGARLIEVDLAEHFGVSRVPVREALRRLESEGFVTVLPRRGTVVRALERADVEELFEVRGPLEVQAVKLATARATPDELKALERTVLDGPRTGARRSRRQLDEANQDFHVLIIQMAHNTLLSSLLEPLQSRLSWLNRQNEDPDAFLAEHRALYEAIASGRVDEAALLATDHVETSRRAVLAQLFQD